VDFLNNSSIVDEIKSRCDIVDVIGRYVTLKRAGSIYKGLCPFHNEKTPSFAVYETKQFFNCYGCGEAGDVISFVMKAENVDFKTAVSKLAEQYGIDMDKFGFRNESKKNEIYELNREAARFFFRNMTERENPGLEYIRKRGLDPKTIAKFGIGYAEDSWDSLIKHLTSKKYSYKLMLEAGLVSYNREKNRYYDKFRNRVIFPIFNTGGKVIGFGGRDLGNNGPKYLNSPESRVFSKKNNLYGLNITRQDINNSNCAIMVEGYMDLVSLYKNGVTNVAASLGTALTENQCQLLKRYTENVVLAYDADAAGQKAALRGIELLHSAGIKAKVLHISDGKDPDEFIKKHGKQAFMKLVDEALPYAEYRISVIRNRHDLSSSEGIIDFLKDVKPVLTSLSPVETDVYIKKLAAETEISESAIRREINSDVMHAADASFTRKDVSSYDNSEAVSNAVLQKNLIRLISVNAEYISRIREYESVFTHPVYYRIYNAMKSLHDDGMIDLKKAADVLEPEDVGVFDDIIRSQPFPVNSDQMLEDLIRKMKTDRLNDRYNDIIQMLDVLPENENEQIEALSQELMMIQSELQNTKQ
jgi:DNA primase